MAALDFHPSKYSFEELLNRRYYQIPRFQRPYSWDSGNLEEFWRDSIEDNDLGYFIGPMVGWSRGEESSIAYVVDGQQRITTISILLSEIRSQFQLLGEERLARGIQRLLERPDRDNEDRFVLQTEDQSPYLNRRILAYPADTTVRPASSNEEGLEGARAWLSARVEKLLTPDGVRMEKADAIGALKDVRDRILALRVIWVNLGNEDDAYIVFETLNSRGKDLAVADLLKNHLLNRIRARNLRADAAREKWDRMRRTLDESSPPIDADRYIQHWWLSQEDYVAQRKLFRAIREKVRTKEQAQERLDSIVNDAPLYRLILEPTSDEWGPEEEAIRDALTGLALFGVTQPAPLLLSMLRARKNGDARLKQLTPSFKAIERFHFQSTVIVGQSSSGGVSAMYARYARALARSE